MGVELVGLIGFWVVSIIHMVGETLATEIKQKVRHITKPFLMPLLLLYYFLGSTNLNGLIIGGILLGWVGDVVLMFPEKPPMFIIGLGSFLLGHILYVIAFIAPTDNFGLVPGWFYALIIVFLGAFYVILKHFKPHLKDMTIPVVVYMLLILTMSYTSLAIVVAGGGEALGGASAPWLLFIGSLCFIASDFMLATQLFIGKKKYDQVFIMLTYLLAQFFIVQGFF